MTEEAHKAIIDRRKVEKFAEDNLKPNLNLLNELVDYGSNLIVRLGDTHNSKLEDVIVQGVFLKQIVSMLDSTSILLEKGASHAAYLSARSAFESSLFLDWILYSDTEKKVKYYYVENLRQDRDSLKKMVSTSPSFKDFNKAMMELGMNIKSSAINYDLRAKKELQEINSILNQPKFSTIDQDFSRKRKHNRDKHWYQMLKARSIRSIAKSLGRIGEYDLFYNKGSKIHHSSSYDRHVRFNKKTVSYIPIRHLENATELLSWITGIVLRAYKSVLQYYRSGEVNNFGRKYLEEWQARYLSIPQIKTVYMDHTEN